GGVGIVATRAWDVARPQPVELGLAPNQFRRLADWRRAASGLGLIGDLRPASGGLRTLARRPRLVEPSGQPAAAPRRHGASDRQARLARLHLHGTNCGPRSHTGDPLNPNE